jgi:2-oxoglutarate dehydrogenase E2 component (dihydrolipoamide succinyltransferase)|tara:strand:+ start:3148 stop:4494 length:1347 start_codon:yes stop_codon:yes gene_type:complete
MSNQILVPFLGESITEATVSKWLKNVGEKIDSDESLVELETDKVNVEVPSPLSGTISSITVKEGETVKVGALLGIINESQSSSKKPNEKKEIDKKEEPFLLKETTNNEKKIKKNEKDVINLNQSKDEKVNGNLILDTLVEEEVPTKEEVPIKEEERKYIPPKTKKHLSPSVRKIVEEKNIDISNIQGTGKDGRISKSDLINLMGNLPEPSKRKSSHGLEERVKMSRLRLTIAKRLKEAQNNAATLTTFNEVDVENIMQMKRDYQEDFQKKYSVKLGFMSFFVKACVVALKNFPAVNAEIENDHIIYNNYYNISIAMGTDRGLVVPVLKKADELSFAEIEKNIFLLSEKAKQGKITINDLQGGTFTISNGGIYGSMLSTPILNPPQTGILGMHNIVERPVVKDGKIVIRPIMYLALSYDHRIIDGKEAVSFLKTIKECLEEPRRLFLDL